MVTGYMFNKIRKLDRQGKNKSQIGRELKICRQTVSKYLKSNTPSKYSSRLKRTKTDIFASFDSQARGLLEHNPDNSAREIYELLVEEGYRGSERTVHRRIAEIRGEKPKERFFEQKYDPAEQSQFDFKECVKLPFVDGMRLVHLHFGTLPHSDTCWVRGYPFRTYECYMDGVHSFFEKIGGITENIRFDNLKPCVLEVQKGSKRIYTDSFKRAIDYYGFGLLPCAPYKGSDKGDVERDIRTFASRIKNLVKNKNIVFHDWDDLNLFLENYMAKRQSERTKELFKEEQKHLLTLPPRDEDVLCKVQIGSSNGYGTIRFGRSVYSVPDNMIEVVCKTVIGAYDVRMYRAGGKRELVAVHPRKPDGEHSILLEHVLPSLVRKPQAMVRWAHREILFPNPVLRKFYNHIKKIDVLGAEREFLRSVNLTQHASFTDIIAGMELLLESKSSTPFDDLRDLLFGKEHSCQVIDITNRLNQKKLQPRLSVYDSLIPKTEEDIQNDT